MKLDATTAPAVTDDSGDGYEVGSVWVDVTNDKTYTCTDATAGAAIWKETSNVASSGNVGGVRCTKSSNQSFSASTITKITWDGTDFDDFSEFNNASDRIEIVQAGAGVIHLYVECTGTAFSIAIYKNGSLFRSSNPSALATGFHSNQVQVITIPDKFTTGDYYEAYIYMGGGTPNVLATRTSFSLIRGG